MPHCYILLPFITSPRSLQLHHGLSKGASIGIAGSAKTLLEDMKHVKPTVLIAVPQLFNKIYDGLQKNRAGMSGVQAKVFDWAMNVGLKRRKKLNKADGAMSVLLNLQWHLAQKLVFDKVRARFGGQLRFSFTGGAPLNRTVQEYFDDMVSSSLCSCNHTPPLSLVPDIYA